MLIITAHHQADNQPGHRKKKCWSGCLSVCPWVCVWALEGDEAGQDLECDHHHHRMKINRCVFFRGIITVGQVSSKSWQTEWGWERFKIKRRTKEKMTSENDYYFQVESLKCQCILMPELSDSQMMGCNPKLGLKLIFSDSVRCGFTSIGQNLNVFNSSISNWKSFFIFNSVHIFSFGSNGLDLVLNGIFVFIITTCY